MAKRKPAEGRLDEIVSARVPKIIGILPKGFKREGDNITVPGGVTVASASVSAQEIVEFLDGAKLPRHVWKALFEHLDFSEIKGDVAYEVKRKSNRKSRDMTSSRYQTVVVEVGKPLVDYRPFEFEVDNPEFYAGVVGQGRGLRVFTFDMQDDLEGLLEKGVKMGMVADTIPLNHDTIVRKGKGKVYVPFFVVPAIVSLTYSANFGSYRDRGTYQGRFKVSSAATFAFTCFGQYYEGRIDLESIDPKTKEVTKPVYEVELITYRNPR